MIQYLCLVLKYRSIWTADQNSLAWSISGFVGDSISTLVFAVTIMLRLDLNWSLYQECVYFIMVALPEIGDILRPRSIWHAVSNYQDGGIKKAVHRKNKDWNNTLSKDLNQFNFFFEVVNTRENEKGETRVWAPVRMTILERRNNFVSCVWLGRVKIIFKNQGPQYT